LSVRHDAAGLWLMKEVGGLSEIAERMLPNLLPSNRDLVFQATCGHHGEPIAVEYNGRIKDVGNERKTVGNSSEKAAVALAQAIVGLFDREASCPIDDRHAPLFSLALSGLTVLADWLGSNRTWFPFRAPSDVEDLEDYWSHLARPSAYKALRESGLLPTRPAQGRGIGDLFAAIREPTELQRFAGEVTFGDGPQLFVIEDMTGAGKTEAAALLAYRLIAAGKACGLYVALPTMATANAMFDRLEKSYRAMFESSSTPSIVLVHGRRSLVEGFANLPGLLAFDDQPHALPGDPSSTTASAFCTDWIRRSALAVRPARGIRGRARAGRRGMTGLYLSRLTLRRDAALAALAPLLVCDDAGPQAGIAHRLVWTAFADDPDRRRDFLWRQDEKSRWFVLSEREPHDVHGFFDVETKPFEPCLAAGNRLAFALRANAVVTITAPIGSI
jgi:hypothetical protein